MLSLALLDRWESHNQAAFLVADDRIDLLEDADRLMMVAPPQLAGLIELRGSGIVATDSHPAALLHYAILPVDLAQAPRLPPEDERFELFEGALLPLVRLASQAPDPFAMLDAIIDFSADSDRDDGLKTVF